MHRDQRGLIDPGRPRAPRLTELLDTSGDPAFDRIATSAARLLDTSVCLVSLVDGQRPVLKSTVGVKELCSKLRETPLSHVLCRQVVTSDRIMAVSDVSALPASNWDRILGELGIRAYAGAPLRVEGQAVGALCVFTLATRAWTTRELELLETLASATEAEIALQLARHELAKDRALQETEAQLRLTVERSPIGIALVSPDGRWLRVNEALCHFVGYSRERLLSIDFQSITHPDDLQPDLQLVQKLLDGELNSYQLEKRYIHRQGHVIWSLLTVSLVRDETGEPAFFISQLQDITERRKLEQELREASLQDDLTGLQNRRGFILLGEQALKSAYRYGRTSVLLFADINGLKTVNDELGHHAGDRLIVAMAETMRATFRRADIVARLGGDEFVLLAEGDETFAGMAEVKLQRAIDTYNERTPSSYPLSASIGTVSATRDDRAELKELLAAADARMYVAKRKYKSSSPASSGDAP